MPVARNPHNVRQWARALLEELGIPKNPVGVYDLRQWAAAEGGHWNNSAHFNPLNTTQNAPGASSMNSVGVKSYGSWDQGLKATVDTLKSGRYGGILKALQGHQPYSEFSQALTSSPWGTKVLPGGGTPPHPSPVQAGFGTPRVSSPAAAPESNPGDSKQAQMFAALGRLSDPNDETSQSNYRLFEALSAPKQGATQPATSDGLPAGGRGVGRQGPRGPLANTGNSIEEMFRVAEAQDKINNKGKLPYQWGGGHGATPAGVGTPVDCSGFVSMILDVAPRVSGDFAASWGHPGKGKHVTVYANDHHVLIAMRDPQTNKWRWFATSRSNPGGGAGEISPPSQEYLSTFAARHPGRRAA